QSLSFDGKINRAAAAVYQRTSCDNASASLLHHAYGFLRRAARGPNILDDQNVLVGSQRKASPQAHGSAGIALDEKRRHATARDAGRPSRLWQGSRYFLTDDDSAERGRDDGLDDSVGKKSCQCLP